MKYYSEQLHKIFDSEEACVKAEKTFEEEERKKKEAEEKKANERKQRAAEVEEAMKMANEAIKNYRELLTKFCKDYGAFHYSFKDKGERNLFWDLLDFDLF